ncbi:MAG: amidase family protein, partial [Bacilli bacterium]
VALGIVPFALGSDTGDSIRKPAAFGGVVGYKPTYGRISRYGLFPFASSLDHVGCFTRCVKDTAYVIDALKGEDIKDMTTLPNENINYVDGLDKSVVGRKLFYFKEMIDIETTDVELKSVLDNFKETISKIKELDIEVESVSFDKQLLNAIFPTYFIISCAEATSNNANLTGIIFGPRDNTNNINEMMFNARTKGFSELIKRRFVIGSYVLQKENQEKLFLNACRVRRLIVEKMNQLFEKYDGLILPSSGGIAPLFGEDLDKLSERYLMLENHMAIGNFGGYPSITLPCGFINKMPIGINITGPAKKDQDVLNISYQIEKQLGYKNINAVRGVEK